MAKLKCVRHDRRIMTVNDQVPPKVVHREDGSQCFGQKVRIGRKAFNVADIHSEYIRHIVSYKSPAEKLLYEIFGADATA